jgi:hypothetical protein
MLKLKTPQAPSDVGRAAADLAAVCDWAKAAGWTVRAVGSKWSFSDVMAPGARLANDRQAIVVKTKDFFHLSRSATDKHLFYVTGGSNIHQVNLALERMKCSLMTSGSSDGQTIAGALGTGVHGSAYRFGAFHNAVVAYHLAIPGEHVLVVRDAASLSAQVQAELVKPFGDPKVVVDAELFDAVSVSFGSFGVLVGVVMRVDEKYALRVLRRPFKSSSVPALIDALKAGEGPEKVDPGLKGLAPTDEAHHCQVLVNLYDPIDYKIVVMHKRYNHPPSDVFHWPEVFDASSVSILKALWGVLDDVDFLYEKFITPQFRGLPDVTAWGYRTDVFGSPEQPLPVHSFAVGLRLDDVVKVLGFAHDSVQKEKFPGAGELRFVKSSTAHLAINRFAPITAVLGFDGLDNDDSWEFTGLFLSKLRAAGVPHSFHWGKMTHMRYDAVGNRKALDTLYGNDLRRWIDARRKFLGLGTAVFDNTFVKRHGLEK